MSRQKGEFPWLAAYDEHVPPGLHYPEKPLWQLFKEAAQKYPDRPALIFFGKKITYRELAGAVDSLAAALGGLGVGKGTRAALLLPNCPQYVLAYYALLQRGATVVPVNPLNTERELEYIFRDAGVKVAFVINLLAERLEKVRQRCQAPGQVVYTSIADFLPFPLNFLYPLQQKMSPAAKAAVKKGLPFKSLLTRAAKAPAAATGTKAAPDPAAPTAATGAAATPAATAATAATAAAETAAAAPAAPAPMTAAAPGEVDIFRDLAVLIYTSGTTGVPKGVMLSHYALIVNAYQCRSWVGIGENDSILGVLPIFHGFGMSVCLNAPLVSGATSILLPRYKPEELLSAIHRYRPTLFAGVPTMYIGLINHPDLPRYNLSSLRGCFAGAASLPPEVKKKFEELTGARLMEGYGLTEAVTAKCANPYEGVNKTGSIGIPFPDTVMKIVDADTGLKELPPGEVGEIVLKSPDLMLGYYKKPEETAATVRDGWLYTGDVGYMDADGYFYVVERKKDLIITGGFNVYPREVEDVLYAHPAVKEACVVGVPDEYRGEAVKAFVVRREGVVCTEEEIIVFCREHLVPYKVPRQVEFRKELPKSAIGKILRKELRKEETT